MNRFILALIFLTFISSANAASCDDKKDDVSKFYCSLKLAEKGDSNAQFDVGYKYYYGVGVTLDLFQSFKWYEKSAVQGNVLAQNLLGFMFYKGEGVLQSYKEAIKWYEKAAENGHPYAPFRIGEMYYIGKGIPRNFLHSLMWCYIAEKRGIKKAGRFRFELEKKMMFEQIKKARELSKIWMNKNK